MTERIEALMGQIETYCHELEQILPKNQAHYRENFEKRAACERYLEKITEALADLARLRIKKEAP